MEKLKLAFKLINIVNENEEDKLEMIMSQFKLLETLRVHHQRKLMLNPQK